MGIMPAQRPTWAEVDLKALEKNYRVLRGHLKAGVQLLAVVKADGYGHGDIPVAKTLAAAGANALGVAIVEEGVALRAAGIKQMPILILGGLFPGQEELVLEHRLTPTIYSLDALERLSLTAQRYRRVAQYHLKIDTGMGRLGLDTREVTPFLAKADGFKGVRLEGVFTHFSSADEEDDGYTRFQITRFREALGEIEATGFLISLKHAANSAGTLYHRDAWFDMVRPGLALYGINPRGKDPQFPLEPILSLKTRITFLKQVASGTPIGYDRTFITQKESVLATIPVGYADGLNRLLSNRGRVIVGDHYAPIVGAVSMDWTLIDVSHVPDVRVGDEVILMGRQGRLSVTAEDIAQATHSIAHEIIARIGKRVPRVYLPGASAFTQVV